MAIRSPIERTVTFGSRAELFDKLGTRPGVSNGASKLHGIFDDLAGYLAKTQRDGRSFYSAWEAAKEESIFYSDKRVMASFDREFEVVVRMIAPEIAQDAINARNAALSRARRVDEIDSLF